MRRENLMRIKHLNGTFKTTEAEESEKTLWQFWEIDGRTKQRRFVQDEKLLYLLKDWQKKDFFWGPYKPRPEKQPST